jgi:hypothetical protein
MFPTELGESFHPISRVIQYIPEIFHICPRAANETLTSAEQKQQTRNEINNEHQPANKW